MYVTQRHPAGGVAQVRWVGGAGGLAALLDSGSVADIRVAEAAGEEGPEAGCGPPHEELAVVEEQAMDNWRDNLLRRDEGKTELQQMHDLVLSSTVGSARVEAVEAGAKGQGAPRVSFSL